MQEQIEREISKNLTGEMRETALKFTAFLKSHGLMVSPRPLGRLGGKDLLLGEIGQKLRMFYRSERSRRA